MKKFALKKIILAVLILSIALNLYFIVANEEKRDKDTLAKLHSQLDLPTYKFTDEELFAYFFLSNNVVPISPVKEVSDEKALPSELIIKPGFYTFNDQVYDLTHEGLYRFFIPQKTNQQRIVFKQDTEALISSLSWIVSHGNTDDSKNLEELNLQARESKLVLTCGTNIKWTQDILQSLGLKSRMVMGLTLDKWNNYDNGHTLIEVYRPEYNKWIVYDLDNDRKFSKNRQPLSFLELVENVNTGDYEVEKISNSIRGDASGFIDQSSGYNYSLLWETMTASDDRIRRWYKRVLQALLIVDPNYNVYFFDEKNRSKIEEYSSAHKYLPKEKFLEKFYE